MRSLLFLKTNHRRGGFIENIYLDGVDCHTLSSAMLEIHTDVLYQWRDLVETVDRRLTRISNLNLSNVNVGEAKYGLYILGEGEQPVTDITLSNVNVGKITKEARVLENVDNLIEEKVIFEMVLCPGDEKALLRFDVVQNSPGQAPGAPGFDPVLQARFHAVHIGIGYDT